MRFRPIAIATVAALAAALIVSAVAGAQLVPIWRNELETTPQRSELIKLFGRACKRSGTEEALRVELGKKTDSCSYRTPVVGRNLEIAATERLLSGTPKPLQRKAYLAVQLRAGGGDKYELRAFPLQRKAQILKVSEAGTKYLAVGKNVKTFGAINEPTVVRLRAINGAGAEKGTTKLTAWVGQTMVGEATDETPAELEGESAAVAIGATKVAEGLVGSVDDVVVRVPSGY